MHALSLVSVDGKVRKEFAMNDYTNKKMSNGLLDGNICSVKYRKNKSGNLEALAVITPECYANAVGRWTLSDPLDAQKKVGIEIEVRGIAKSINMSTLNFKYWLIGEADNSVTLIGRSSGNGDSFEVKRNGTITKKDGRLILTLEDGTVYIKEK